MASKQDVVVIGAGIIGCSVAFELTQRGYTDVTIVDRDHVAAGGTGVSSGVLRQFYTEPTLVEMALYGRNRYENFGEVVGGTASFVETGWVLAATESSCQIARRGLEVEAAAGVRSEWIDVAAISQLLPGIRSDDLVGGVYEPTAGYADPASAAQALLSSARQRGVVYRPGTRVISLTLGSKPAVRVHTTEGLLDSDLVVIAAGPWSASLAADVGLVARITASKHIVATLSHPADDHRPIFSDPANHVYIRPESSSLALAGSNDPTDSTYLVDPDSYPAAVEESRLEDLLARISMRFPSLCESGVASSWSGLYDVSNDAFPILGPVPGAPGVLIAAGMSGHGFKLAPAIGDILASAVLDSTPDPRISLFRPERFAQNDPIRSISTSSLTSMGRDDE